jgi:hypothetical protein
MEKSIMNTRPKKLTLFWWSVSHNLFTDVLEDGSALHKLFKFLHVCCKIQPLLPLNLWLNEILVC